MDVFDPGRNFFIYQLESLGKLSLVINDFKELAILWNRTTSTWNIFFSYLFSSIANDWLAGTIYFQVIFSSKIYQYSNTHTHRFPPMPLPHAQSKDFPGALGETHPFFVFSAVALLVGFGDSRETPKLPLFRLPSPPAGGNVLGDPRKRWFAAREWRKTPEKSTKKGPRGCSLDHSFRLVEAWRPRNVPKPHEKQAPRFCFILFFSFSFFSFKPANTPRTKLFEKASFCLPLTLGPADVAVKQTCDAPVWEVDRSGKWGESFWCFRSIGVTDRWRHKFVLMSG